MRNSRLRAAITYVLFVTLLLVTFPASRVNASYILGPGATTTTVIWDIGATFDGGGSAITNGKTTYFTYVHSACTVKAWNVTVDTGTITIDVWKVASGTAIPTIADTITGSATPAIASNTVVHSTTLTGWTTSVAKNDIFGVSVTAISGATTASLDVECQQN